MEEYVETEKEGESTIRYYIKKQRDERVSGRDDVDVDENDVTRFLSIDA